MTNIISFLEQHSLEVEKINDNTLKILNARYLYNKDTDTAKYFDDVLVFNKDKTITEKQLYENGNTESISEINHGSLVDNIKWYLNY